MRKSFVFLAALVIFSFALTAYAKEPHNRKHNDPAAHGTPVEQEGHDRSIHRKIDQILKEAPSHLFYTVSPADKKHNDYIIDVRTREIFAKTPRKDAVNIPLPLLHDHLRDLPRDRRVLVFGGNDIEAAYAAFVLRLHDINGWLVKDAPTRGKKAK
ncbi:MAG: hypothetical protein LBP78_07715 [Acidaminococcales bacterium]|jgi:cbb3-type cytochrome oxidase subunit 3/rhodanese-related sulfurtransferase|nr:hypothetical protein [Acidaminococcales bacterium]